MNLQTALCITAAAVGFIVAMSLVYFCLILSGRISRAEERRERERKHKPPKEKL